MATTALARRYRLQVNTGTTGSPVWTTVTGLTDFKPTINPTMQDDSDYETDGWNSSEKTAQGWQIEATVLLKDDGSGTFNSGVEKMRLASDQFGDTSRVEVRWFDKDGRAEAYQGTALVTWERANSGNTDLDAAKVTLTGRGARTSIANPLIADPLADPAVTALAPNTGPAAGNTLATISGINFTGATAVTFGGTAATTFRVISPSVISVVTPAKAAGQYDVVVTTPNGTSAASAASKYTYV
ncbi:phage tail tube protein [Micromonospora tarensis]|uniref:IPT/TIG domain-containing protein n=1 Tax=Micromonospora tarensis TaxID=2806100 RepID=A0ABS1YD90_9ACTN|nr:IPT/TIG domain-containing protein [Micromonospora tarensis]MBM0275322.1 IPT/TIG domain-containing protein [Micromonospora tarensis]